MVELGLVEQPYQAVLEVLNEGVPVTEVAARFAVTRQSVHRWLKSYAARGLAGLVDGSTVPGSCPHQMAPVVEAPGSWRCVRSIRGGAHERSATGSPVKGSSRCRGGRRSTGVWSATA